MIRNVTRFRASALFLSVATLCVIVACGDDDDDAPLGQGGSSATGGKTSSGGSATAGKANGGAQNGAGEVGAPTAQGGEAGTPITQAGAPGNEAVYALTTQVFGETENQSYVLLTGTLEQGTELSLGDAVVEVAGRALGTGPEGSGVLFVAGDLGPTITRYELTETGQLAGSGTVSFLGQGVTKFGEYGGQFQYVGQDKAYWFDGPTAQIVVWNPSTMKVTSSVELSGLAQENETLSFTAAPVRHGDKLYSFAAWRQGLTITQRLAVIVLDTKSNEVQVVEDTRCGYVRDGVLADDGFLYVATEAFGSAAHFLNAENPVPCLLRFNPEKNEFDDGFQIALSELADGSSAGSLVVGPDNQAFLRVLDVDAVPADVTNPRVLASAGVWSWSKLTPGAEPELRAVDEVPLAGGSVLPVKLGSRVFAPLFVDGETTRFLELTKDGPAPGEAISVPGLVFSAVKLK